MSNKVKCEICGKGFARIGNHISVHGMNLADYRNSFPEAETCAYKHSDETRDRMKGPREKAKGVKKSDAHRKALSDSRKGRKFKPHSPETIRKMREAWARRKEDKEAYALYVQSVSQRMSSPEMLLVLRERFAKLIKDGNHNGKSSDTSLERRMVRFLDLEGIKFETQKIVETRKGCFTFDFFIPHLNLLVEADGEYWHRKSVEQFNRDILKERLAKEMGYRVVRISDLDWRPEMVLASDSEIERHNDSIMQVRSDYLSSK